MKWVIGFDFVGRNLKIIATELFLFALVFAIACALNRWLGRSRHQRLWALLVFAATAFALMQVDLNDQGQYRLIFRPRS